MNNDVLERLAILNEECGEVVHIISKILRHGMDSYNPNDEIRTPNKVYLENEVADLLFAIGFLMGAEDINTEEVFKAVHQRKLTITKYLHSQQEMPDNAIISLLHYKDYTGGMYATDKTPLQIWEGFMAKLNMTNGVVGHVLAPAKDIFIDYLERITTEL